MIEIQIGTFYVLAELRRIKFAVEKLLLTGTFTQILSDTCEKSSHLSLNLPYPITTEINVIQSQLIRKDYNKIKLEENIKIFKLKFRNYVINLFIFVYVNT